MGAVESPRRLAGKVRSASRRGGPGGRPAAAVRAHRSFARREAVAGGRPNGSGNRRWDGMRPGGTSGCGQGRRVDKCCDNLKAVNQRRSPLRPPPP